MKTKYPRISSKTREQLKNIDFQQIGLSTANDDLDSCYGKRGTKTREEFETKAEAWYYGEILRERRKELGITQKELAERIGRERTYINRIERGDTDMQLSSFLRIASALGISLQLSFSV